MNDAAQCRIINDLLSFYSTRYIEAKFMLSFEDFSLRLQELLIVPAYFACDNSPLSCCTSLDRNNLVKIHLEPENREHLVKKNFKCIVLHTSTSFEVGYL